MTLLGKNSFIRKQEKAFAKKLLIWKYEAAGDPKPDDAALSAHAEQVVDQAHILAKKSGNSVVEILKALITDIQNKKKS